MPTRILHRDPATGQLRELTPADFGPERPPGILWLDLTEPTREDLAWLGAHFGFHPLALEDCLKSGQRPKIEPYDGYMFLDVYAAAFEAASCQIRLHELDVFLGPDYLVTSHHDPWPDAAGILERWRSDRTLGPDHLLYLILDTVVDAYFPVVDQLEDQLELVEEKLFASFQQRLIGEIFGLRKQLVLFRKVVAPTRDVCLMLSRREHGLVQPGTAMYLQDVYDHLIRVTDAIDTYRDLVAGVLEAYLSVVANRTNDTMKRLTSLSAILMTVALVPAFYGMNFPTMPWLSAPLGYTYALGLMIMLSLALLAWFKAIRYF